MIFADWGKLIEVATGAILSATIITLLLKGRFLTREDFNKLMTEKDNKLSKLDTKVYSTDASLLEQQATQKSLHDDVKELKLVVKDLTNVVIELRTSLARVDATLNSIK